MSDIISSIMLTDFKHRRIFKQFVSKSVATLVSASEVKLKSLHRVR